MIGRVLVPGRWEECGNSSEWESHAHQPINAWGADVRLEKAGPSGDGSHGTNVLKPHFSYQLP